MSSRQIAIAGLRNGAGAIAYIACIAWFFSAASGAFVDKSIFIPMMMLTLFVLSALIEASLVLGQPILMFVQGEKKDAVKVLGTTVAFMVICLSVFIALNLR